MQGGTARRGCGKEDACIQRAQRGPCCATAAAQRARPRPPPPTTPAPALHPALHPAPAPHPHDPDARHLVHGHHGPLKAVVQSLHRGVVGRQAPHRRQPLAQVRVPQLRAGCGCGGGVGVGQGGVRAGAGAAAGVLGCSSRSFGSLNSTRPPLVHHHRQPQRQAPAQHAAGGSAGRRCPCPPPGRMGRERRPHLI